MVNYKTKYLKYKLKYKKLCNKFTGGMEAALSEPTDEQIECMTDININLLSHNINSNTLLFIGDSRAEFRNNMPGFSRFDCILTASYDSANDEIHIMKLLSGRFINEDDLEIMKQLFDFEDYDKKNPESNTKIIHKLFTEAFDYYFENYEIDGQNLFDHEFYDSDSASVNLTDYYTKMYSTVKDINPISKVGCTNYFLPCIINKLKTIEGLDNITDDTKVSLSAADFTIRPVFNPINGELNTDRRRWLNLVYKYEQIGFTVDKEILKKIFLTMDWGSVKNLMIALREFGIEPSTVKLDEYKY